MELAAGPLDPVAGTRAPRRGHIVAHVEHDDNVGLEPPGGDLVDLLDDLDSQAAADALVRERRRDVAVGDDDVAPVEGGPDHLGDLLGAVRR